MFFLELISIVFVAFIAPAVAIRPQLIVEPRLSVAIPILSILVVYSISLILTNTGLFQTPVVRSISACLVVVAITRCTLQARNGLLQLNWPSTHLYIVLFNVFVALFFMAKLASSGFDTDDEIYSWNMWSVQYFLHDDIDYQFTQAPYPQLFPRVLSYCYMFLGSTELQIPVKASLAVLPFVLFSAIGLSSSRITTRTFWLHASLVIAFSFLVKAGKLFDDGMPDTMTATALVASVFFFNIYRDEHEKYEFIVLSILCATVALLSKQPGLLWALFSLPLLAILLVVRRELPSKTLFAIALPIAVGSIWLMTEGSGFQNNQGVLSRSFQDRDYFSQLLHGAGINIARVPAVALLVLLAFTSVFRAKRGRSVFLLYVVPGLVSWFLFASYDMRAGLSALSVCALLLAYSNYLLPSGVGRSSTKLDSIHDRKIVTTISFLFGLNIYYGIASTMQTYERDPGFDFAKGSRNTIHKFFGKDAEFVYNEIFLDDKLTIWINSNYIYGIFYGQVNIVQPQVRAGAAYGSQEFLSEIERDRPDYLFHSGAFATGRAEQALLKLATQDCPDMFSLVAGPSSKRRYSVYKLEKAVLSSGYCTL